MFKLLTSFLLFFLFLSPALAEKICVKIIDGEKVYTNICDIEVKKIQTKKSINNKILSSRICREELEKIVEEKSRLYGVDSRLIKEMIAEESEWNVNAVSPKGAMGIMQLMPGTAILMGVKNPFDPVENIDGGIRYMKYLLEKFNGNVSLALAAYNAGPNLVESLGRIPRIAETQNYVRKISLRYSGNGYLNSKKRHPSIKAIILPDGTIIYTNREDMYIWSVAQ
uniref:Lytic transglycosylase domain-containing protein n=1 Tax=Thermodesulfovibrio aggregans TaxID=86166 RepID=A0A7C4AJ67_9BACT